MTRSSFRPIASVGLVAAVLVYVGCAKTHETPESTGADTSTVRTTTVSTEAPKTPLADVKGEQVPKLFEDWSAKPPAGILLISGEQYGYPDPCGCTEGQLGGLGRRYDLCDKLKARGWPVAKIDLGSLIHYQSDTARGGSEQEKIKFDVIFEALGMMKYDAVALGAEDMKLGVLDTLSKLLNSQPPKFPIFLAANVKPLDKELAGTIGSVKFTQAGPITVGITAVLDPIAFEGLQDANANLLEVKPPDDVLPAILAELTKRSKVKVLMVQGPHEEAKRLAEKFPGFDIVVGTSDFIDPDEHAETLNDGKTLLVNNIGKKGKYVGLVGFFPGSKPMLQFRRQALDQEHFHQAEPMRVLIDVDYQDRLKREQVVENFPRFANASYPAGAKYSGAESCQACHPKTFEKWASTKHARAFDALTNPKRNRVFDAECISCHTTGFGYKTGYVSAEQTSFLKGNQCENCHGPASFHVADPVNEDFRKPMRMSREQAEATNFCTKCHDEDNDHNFTFDGRYAQIFHKGLDDYSDPKVRQKSASR